MKHIFENIKERYEKTRYTIQHKIAFLKVEKQLLGHNTLSGYMHDVDKLFLYWFFIMGVKDVSDFHRKHSRHHVENKLAKTKKNLIESVIDWECARITKPDKPLNAYGTLVKYYPEHKDTYLPIIKEFLPDQVQKGK